MGSERAHGAAPEAAFLPVSLLAIPLRTVVCPFSPCFTSLRTVVLFPFSPFWP